MARMNWSDVLYDDADGALNTAGGQFTSKKAGVYLFHVRLLIQSENSAAGLQYSDLGGGFSNALSLKKNRTQEFYRP